MSDRERFIRVVLLVLSVALLAYLFDVFMWGRPYEKAPPAIASGAR